MAVIKYTAKVRRGMSLSFKIINAALQDDLTVKSTMKEWSAAQHSDFDAFLDWAAQEIGAQPTLPPAGPPAVEGDY